MGKKIILILSLVILCGCSPKYSYSYACLNDVIEALENKQTFYVEFSQTGCVDCKVFKKEVINKTSFDRPLYIVNVSEENGQKDNLIKIIEEYFGEIHFTPTIFKVESGKIDGTLIFDEEMNLSDWYDFI